jgi:formylglycine-generating enzyme required for sulfatase activity
MTPELTISGPSGEYQVMRSQLLGNEMTWITITNVSLAGNTIVFYDSTAENVRQHYQAVQKTNPDNPYPQLLVRIPSGAFTMGGSHLSNQGPRTQVTISRGFWIGKYEVTQKEYQRVMGNNPSFFTGDLNRPVEQVSWYDATNFCGKLTLQEQKAGTLPSGYVYRLPTEAEWEYACRAGTTTKFSWGDDYTCLGNYTWYQGNSWYSIRPDGRSDDSGGKYYTTHSVGQKLPNPWGLYDMHGNVREWSLDFYSDSLPGGSVTDPKGPSSGLERVVCGGCWNEFASYCDSAQRYGGTPSNISRVIGFRPVLAPGQ